MRHIRQYILNINVGLDNIDVDDDDKLFELVSVNTKPLRLVYYEPWPQSTTPHIKHRVMGNAYDLPFVAGPSR